MIEKLDIKNGGVEDLLNCIKKINEVIDVVNAIQKEREAEQFEIREWIGILEAVRKSVNVHEKQIDELQMKAEPQKCEPQDIYAEQRRWIGKLCRFWDNNKKEWVIDFLRAVAYGYADTPYRGNKDWYEHCEPVKPDDDIIYKGGTND